MKTILSIICAFIIGLYLGGIWHLCSDNIHIARCNKELMDCSNQLIMKDMKIEIAGASDEGMKKTWEK